ncbi:MAG: hypothetical protein IVW56_01610 [Candidatus Binataceae bacterium]|nr:hypothetical protein [Candidatus Binataceae bacterium]
MKSGLSPLRYLALIALVGCASAATEHQSRDIILYPTPATTPGAPRFVSADGAASAGPNDWVMVAEKQAAGNWTVRDYVHKGQSAENWTELVTYMNTGKPGDSPAEFAQRQAANLVKQCPGASTTIQSQSAGEVTYEARTGGCASVGSQDTITRAIYASDNMFLISYTAKTGDLTPAQRAAAQRMLAGFTLQPRS